MTDCHSVRLFVLFETAEAGVRGRKLHAALLRVTNDCKGDKNESRISEKTVNKPVDKACGVNYNKYAGRNTLYTRLSETKI